MQVLLSFESVIDHGMLSRTTWRYGVGRMQNDNTSNKPNLKRREFLVGTGGIATFAAASKFMIWSNAAKAQEAGAFPPSNKDVPRTVIGYSSEVTARPGETVDIMVSSLEDRPLDADLVRIVNGDSLSRYHEMFQLDPVPSDFAKTYEARRQDLNLGSYAEVSATGPLDDLDDFSIGLWVFPTFNPANYEAPDLDNIDPFSPPTLTIADNIATQTLVSRFDAAANTGWRLAINPEFQLEFAISNGDSSSESVVLPAPLKDWDWVYVCATYDSTRKSLSLYALERPYAPGDQFAARDMSTSETLTGTVAHQGPLRIAATRDGAGAAMSEQDKPGDVFNGRIQDVRVLSRVLESGKIEELGAEAVPISLRGDVVAAWDFALDMSTTIIRDTSANGLDGVVVNLPERAVRGRFWDGSTTQWTDHPEQYDAITFHADDLYDAEWEPLFSFTIPDSLKSGVYAIRLKDGDFAEYITLMVAPPKGRPSANFALVMSEMNYMAYSNVTLGATARQNYPGHNFNDSDIEFLKENKEFGTGGVYNQHVDGLYYIYGSRKRPDVHFKPGAFMYNFAQDTHITAFLEHLGIEYDILTEELVDREGIGLLSQYSVVCSATHPEYITAGIFDAYTQYTAEGGRYIYIGGNGAFWAVDADAVLPGVMESRNFMAMSERWLTSGAQGGLMVETGRLPGASFGLEMGGMIFNGSSGYKLLADAEDPRANWIFEGVTSNVGDIFGEYGVDRVFGGAAGFEIDRFNPGNGAPRHTLHLATSDELKPKIEDVKTLNLPLAITYHPSEKNIWSRADMVFFETPLGGAVFSTGSIAWISSCLHNNFDNDISRVTENVFRRFLDPTPFPTIEDDDLHSVNRVLDDPKYSEEDPRLKSDD